MATRNAVQSLRNLLVALLVVGSLTTACKKSGGSDPDVDPRDQYVGSYEGGYQATIRIADGDGLDPESGTAVITVSKSTVAKQLYLDILFNNTTKERLTAELTDGTSFTIIDKTQDQISINNTKIDATYTATGAFDKTQVAISTAAQGLRGGVKYAKYGSITGTKK
ncbi:hypothetical protein [Spirosoma fluminis]